MRDKRTLIQTEDDLHPPVVFRIFGAVMCACLYGGAVLAAFAMVPVEMVKEMRKRKVER